MSPLSPGDPGPVRHPADAVACSTDPGLPAVFQASPGRLRLRAGCSEFDRRHGLELARLLAACFDADPVLVGCMAARTALLAGRLDVARGLSPSLPDQPWIPFLQGETPDAAALALAWPLLATRQPDAKDPFNAGVLAVLRRVWPLLGPTDWLLGRGGDARLRLDPATGLNAYGCDTRPQPGLVSFASSTASSVSERGYAEAERTRRRLLAAAMRGEDASADEAGAIRAALAAYFEVPEGGGVVLAASGTDCGLFTLAVALAGHAPGGAPPTCIVLAPEETGSGTPLAVVGRHFAAGTSRGRMVAKGEALAGYPAGIRLVAVPGRDADGAPRPMAAIEADCAHALRTAPGAALLQLLDVSKTGLLLPDIDCDMDSGVNRIAGLVAPHAERVSVVVDACQARLAPTRVGAYLRAGWMVQVTGSKFYAGPPFAGALLLPARAMRRLADGAALPEGLRDYALRAEWPPCAAAGALDAGANPGLLLRWRAALAEMRAFAAVPAVVRHRILSGFLNAARDAVARHPDLLLVPSPPPARDAPGAIVGFAIRDRATLLPLGPEAARAMHELLRADLSSRLSGLDPEREALARLRCHVGQPVSLPAAHGGAQGVLRLSASARLVSGDPGEEAWPPQARLDRAAADMERVLRKLSLILDHWHRIAPGSSRP